MIKLKFSLSTLSMLILSVIIGYNSSWYFAIVLWLYSIFDALVDIRKILLVIEDKQRGKSKR